MKHEVVETTQEHVEKLATTMQAADVLECERATGQTPLDALETMLKVNTECWTWLVEGEVGAIYGVLHSQLGTMVTLLGSDLIRKYPRKFLFITQISAWYFLDKYGSLYNYVDAEYTRSIKWLEWLGFEIAPAKPLGPNGWPFHIATLEADNG